MKKGGTSRGAIPRIGSGRGRPKGTGSHSVYAELCRRILRLDLPPGTALDEQALVREFKVSRTPVREALLRLANDDLVEITPNRGARVASLHLQDVPEIFDALEIGLRVTSRWAALRHTTAQLNDIRAQARAFADAAARDDFHRMTEANRDYHLAVADAAGNRHLKRMLAALLSTSFRFAYLSLARGSKVANLFPGGFPQIVREHDELIALIAAGDAPGADRLAAQHTRMFRAKVIEMLIANSPPAMPLDGLDEVPDRRARR